MIMGTSRSEVSRLCDQILGSGRTSTRMPRWGRSFGGCRKIKPHPSGVRSTQRGGRRKPRYSWTQARLERPGHPEGSLGILVMAGGWEEDLALLSNNTC